MYITEYWTFSSRLFKTVLLCFIRRKNKNRQSSSTLNRSDYPDLFPEFRYWVGWNHFPLSRFKIEQSLKELLNHESSRSENLKGHFSVNLTF